MDLHIFLEVIRSLQVIQQVLRLENSTVQRNLGFTDRTTCRICMSFFRNITCDNSQRASLPSWPKKICVRPLYKPHQTVLSPGCKQTLVLLSLPAAGVTPQPGSSKLRSGAILVFPSKAGQPLCVCVRLIQKIKQQVNRFCEVQRKSITKSNDSDAI